MTNELTMQNNSSNYTGINEWNQMKIRPFYH